MQAQEGMFFSLFAETRIPEHVKRQEKCHCYCLQAFFDCFYVPILLQAFHNISLKKCLMMTRSSTLFIKASLNVSPNPLPLSIFGCVVQVFKSSGMNLLTVLSLCPAPAASQQPEVKKEPKQEDEQVQKKKKIKKVKASEEGSFQHFALSKVNEAQSNGGTAIGSSDSSLQVSSLSFRNIQQSLCSMCRNANFNPALSAGQTGKNLILRRHV